MGVGPPLSLLGSACLATLLACAAGQNAGAVTGALLKKRHEQKKAPSPPPRYKPSANDSFWDVLTPFRTAWPVQQFEAVDHSHNWCDIEDRILNGELHYKDALRGQQVSVLFANTGIPGAVQFDEASQTIGGGMSVEVFKEVAKRAGFSWKETAAVSDYVDPSLSNKTNDDWLLWATENYDVVDWHAITTKRRELGLNFAYPFVDCSVNLVGSVNVRETGFFRRFWIYLKPFSPDLWLMILTGLLLSAGTYMLLEGKGELKEAGTPLQSLGHAFFSTCGQCTAAAGFAPETPAGKLFVVSISFLAMVLVTAFTANLASFMIVLTVSTPSVSSIEEVQQNGVPVCVIKGSTYQELLQHRYPDLKFQEVTRVYDKLRAVERGECAAGVVGENSWEVLKKISFYNPTCNLELIGRPIISVGGSFASKTDATSRRCKELVTNVMASTMHQMYLEGFYELVKEMVFDEVQDIYCSEYRQGLSSSSQMLPKHFEGAFVAHYIVGFICVLFSLHQGHIKLSSLFKRRTSRHGVSSL